jgi:hypothetical protein
VTKNQFDEPRQEQQEGETKEGIDYFCPALGGYRLGAAQGDFSFRVSEIGDGPSQPFKINSKEGAPGFHRPACHRHLL